MSTAYKKVLEKKKNAEVSLFDEEKALSQSSEEDVDDSASSDEEVKKPVVKAPILTKLPE